MKMIIISKKKKQLGLYKKIISINNDARLIDMFSTKLFGQTTEQLMLTNLYPFFQISNVIHEIRALDINSQLVFPLGETAASIRGENELWLAIVLRSKILLDLKPAQLAAVCGGLVSEGIKVRPWKNNRYILLLLNIASLQGEDHCYH